MASLSAGEARATWLPRSLLLAPHRGPSPPPPLVCLVVQDGPSLRPQYDKPSSVFQSAKEVRPGWLVISGYKCMVWCTRVVFEERSCSRLLFGRRLAIAEVCVRACQWTSGSRPNRRRQHPHPASTKPGDSLGSILCTVDDQTYVRVWCAVVQSLQCVVSPGACLATFCSLTVGAPAVCLCCAAVLKEVCVCVNGRAGHSWHDQQRRATVPCRWRLGGARPRLL
jgi:hypothetical protein